MKLLLPATLLLAADGLLTACHPDAPATATSLRSGDAERPSAYDTLHVAGGGVLRLKPITEAAFLRVPKDTAFPATDYEATLSADAGPVRRQGPDLILQPAQGPVITFRNKQEQVELPGGTGSYLEGTHTYYYRGPLPGTHQWLVELNEPHHPYYCLLDQRTGQRTNLVGFPVLSPDGRYLLSVASGLYVDRGVDGPFGLQLYRLGSGAPRLGWLRNPQRWGPTDARWAGPRTVVLAQAHLLPSGQDASPDYIEVTLP